MTDVDVVSPGGLPDPAGTDTARCTSRRSGRGRRRSRGRVDLRRVSQRRPSRGRAPAREMEGWDDPAAAARAARLAAGDPGAAGEALGDPAGLLSAAYDRAFVSALDTVLLVRSASCSTASWRPSGSSARHGRTQPPAVLTGLPARDRCRPSHLSHRRPARAGHRDDVPTELRRERLGHGAIVHVRPQPGGEEPAERGAVTASSASPHSSTRRATPPRGTGSLHLDGRDRRAPGGARRSSSTHLVVLSCSGTGDPSSRLRGLSRQHAARRGSRRSPLGAARS